MHMIDISMNVGQINSHVVWVHKNLYLQENQFKRKIIICLKLRNGQIHTCESYMNQNIVNQIANNKIKWYNTFIVQLLYNNKIL